MAFTIKSRYGSLEDRGDDVDIEAVVEDLIQELETEQFEEPDDEHYQVAVCFGNWGITVFVSGLIGLDDLTGTAVPFNSLYLRATDRSAVVRLLCQLARGEIEQVRSAGWTAFENLPPYQSDFFRRPLTDEEKARQNSEE